MPAPNLISALLSWYDANGRDLPWRRSHGTACSEPLEPYAVMVSEFMLQQTTVQAVFPYFERWMEKYPAIEDLAAAEPEQVLRDWEGLGYYSRARNLHAAAREVMLRYGGTIPKDPRELQKLPGIGGYTAAAVASIAFGVRVPALDANNLRVWSRILVSSDRRRITRIFNRCLPTGRPGDFNQALMDLGSLVCTPRDPDCPACPISGWCRAHRTDRVEEFPRRESRSKTTRLEAAIGIVVEDNRVLVQRRPENGLLAGLWEFPGGKMETHEPQRTRRNAEKNDKTGRSHKRAERRQKPGGRRQETEARRQKTEDRSQSRAQKDLETPEEAVVREVREETGLRVQVRQKLGVFTHSYTRFNVKLHVFLCRKKSGRLHRPEALWVTLEELQRLPMPSANRKIAGALEKHLDAARGRQGEKTGRKI